MQGSLWTHCDGTPALASVPSHDPARRGHGVDARGPRATSGSVKPNPTMTAVRPATQSICRLHVTCRDEASIQPTGSDNQERRDGYLPDADRSDASPPRGTYPGRARWGLRSTGRNRGPA